MSVGDWLYERSKNGRTARREVRDLVFRFPGAVGTVVTQIERGEVNGYNYSTCVYGRFCRAAGAECGREQAHDVRAQVRGCDDKWSPLERLTAKVMFGDTPETSRALRLILKWTREAVSDREVILSRHPVAQSHGAHV